jgi:V/A-type H+-transporting ATPase subunit K
MVGLIWALFGAALAVILGGIGSSIGTSVVGVAASGLVSREPDKSTSGLLLQVLPGTQGIFGFLGAYLVLSKLQLTSANPITNIDTGTGIMIFAACLPVGVLGLLSSYFQSKVASASVNIVAKAGSKHVVKGIIYAAVVETYSIIGLVATLMMLQGIKVAPAATSLVLPVFGGMA